MTTSIQGNLARRAGAVVTRSRLTLGLWAAGSALLGVGLVLGVVVLVSRSLLGVDPYRWTLGQLPGGASGWLGWAAAGVLVLGIALWAALRARRVGMNEREAALWLDVRSGASGEVVTQRELGEAGALWRSHAEARARTVTELPALAWRPAALRAALGAAFIALAALAPIRQGGSEARFEALFDERLEEVREQLVALEEEVSLTEDDRAELTETLERLESDAENSPDLEATYEAIDRLEERLAERAEEASEAAQRAVDALQRAGESLSSASESAAGVDPSEAMENPDDLALDQEALAEALEAAADLSMTEFDLAAAGSQLAEALASLNPSGTEGLDLSELAKLARDGGLSGLDADALAELSQELLDAMADSLQGLADAGLLEGVKLKPVSGLPKLSADQLAKLAQLAEQHAAEPHSCPDCGRTDPGEPGEP